MWIQGLNCCTHQWLPGASRPQLRVGLWLISCWLFPCMPCVANLTAALCSWARWLLMFAGRSSAAHRGCGATWMTCGLGCAPSSSQLDKGIHRQRPSPLPPCHHHHASRRPRCEPNNCIVCRLPSIALMCMVSLRQIETGCCHLAAAWAHHCQQSMGRLPVALRTAEEASSIPCC